MELRERVQSAIYAAIPEEAFGWSDDTIDGERIAIIEGRVNVHRLADAAIAAVLDAMQPLTEKMENAAYDKARDSSFWITDEIWQAMLAAFRTEALGEG